MLKKVIDLNIIQNKFFYHWIILAILSLAFAGLFSVILVLLRVPQIHNFIPLNDFFKTSLIVHVDLSILLWFFTIQAAFITNYISNKFDYYLRIIFLIKIISLILLVVSPFIIDSKPFLNNYVPILENIYFIFGLALYFAAYLLLLTLFFISLILNRHLIILNDPEFIFTFSTSIISLFSIIAIYLSYKQLMNMPEIWDSNTQFFYEMLFWGGGHLIQYMYLSIGQLAWIFFAQKFLDEPRLVTRLSKIIFLINLVLVLPMPYYFFYYPISQGEYVAFYTDHMKYFGGISSYILFPAIIFDAIQSRRFIKNFSVHFFIISLILFIIGGIVGLKIQYSNTEIPAHYHGSMVSISIAMMGLIYNLLQKRFFFPIKEKIIILQIYIFGIGQLLHVLGLAFSGGYGVLRKSPGGVYPVEVKIYLAMLGAGGITAMIGGIMFVIFCFVIIINGQKNIK